MMPSYPIPKDLVAEYSAACQIVSQYEELCALAPVDPEKAAWAGAGTSGGTNGGTNHAAGARAHIAPR